MQSTISLNKWHDIIWIIWWRRTKNFIPFNFAAATLFTVIYYVIYIFLAFCSNEEFSCRTGGQCVRRVVVCDGKFDCADYSDESDCRKSCYAFPSFVYTTYRLWDNSYVKTLITIIIIIICDLWRGRNHVYDHMSLDLNCTCMVFHLHRAQEMSVVD
jgi:hypothetical protein